jgi:hypothetical protein
MVMNQTKRILIAIAILVVIVCIIFGVDYFQRQRQASLRPENNPPGSIPIYVDDNYLASFVPDDLDQLEGASFVDTEEGKTQSGWLLIDVLGLYVDQDTINIDTQITISSSSREKSKTLPWIEVENPDNFVMFDLSSRGTLKFVSNMQGFDTRDAWVQDVDKIELVNP